MKKRRRRKVELIFDTTTTNLKSATIKRLSKKKHLRFSISSNTDFNTTTRNTGRRLGVSFTDLYFYKCFKHIRVCWPNLQSIFKCS